MNSIIKKNGLQVGLILSVIQVLITVYLYYYGSFIDLKFGILIIIFNLFFGGVAIFITKKKFNNLITLKESFSSYFLTILVSMLISSTFYMGFFEIVATDVKKELIKSELFAFNLQSMRENNYLDKDIQKSIQLSKNSNPFSFTTVFQSFIKNLILYSVVGLIISFVFKNKSSSQEISIQ